MKKFMRDDSGATAIEYGMIASAMAIVLLSSFPAVSTAVGARITSVGGAFAAAK
jgi:pilus assembly protein Flp/PilA